MKLNEQVEQALKLWVARRVAAISEVDSGLLADYAVALIVTIDTDGPNSLLEVTLASQLEDFLRSGALDFARDLLRTIKSGSFTPLPIQSSISVEQAPDSSDAFKPPQSRFTSPNTTTNTGFHVAAGLIDREKRSSDSGNSQMIVRTAHSSRRNDCITKNVSLKLNVSHKSRLSTALRQQAPTDNQLPRSLRPDSHRPGQLMPSCSPSRVASRDSRMMIVEEKQVSTVSNKRPKTSTKAPVRAQACQKYLTSGTCNCGLNCNRFESREQDPISAVAEKHRPVTHTTPSIRKAKLVLSPHKKRSYTRIQRKHQPKLSMAARDSESDMRTIRVEHIPEEKLDEQNIHQIFEEFGPIDSLFTWPSGGIAVIRFHHRESAKAAYESPPVMINNKLTELYWHSSNDQNYTNLQAIEPSSSDSSMACQLTDTVSNSQANLPKISAQAQEIPGKVENIIQARELLFELEEQLSALERLDKLQNQMSKLERDIFSTLQQLGVKMEAGRLRLSPLMHDAIEFEHWKYHRNAQTFKVGLDAIKRDFLKQRVDMNKSIGSIPTIQRTTSKKDVERAEELPSNRQGTHGVLPRGTARRGSFSSRKLVTSRSRFRGRILAGGKYNLDLRPKMIRVSTADGVWDEDRDDALHSYLSAFEEVEMTENVPSNETGNVIVSFKDRLSAEGFFYGPRELPNIGTVHLAWVTSQQSPTSYPSKGDTNEQVSSITTGVLDDILENKVEYRPDAKDMDGQNEPIL